MDTRLNRLIIAATIASPTLAIAGPIYSNNFESSDTRPEAHWSTSLSRDLGGPYTSFLGRFGNHSVTLRLDATEANTAGIGDDNAQEPFNITIRQYKQDRVPIPELDGGGGGGSPGKSSPNPPNAFKFNLGGALNAGGGSSDDPNAQPRFTPGMYALTFDLMLFDSWDANYDGYGPDKFSVAINGEQHFDELLEIHHLPNNFRMPDELPQLNAYNQSWQDQIYRDISIAFEIDQATDHFDFAFIGTLNQHISDESWGLDNIRVEHTGQLRGASSPIVPAPGALVTLGAGLGLLGKRRR